MRSNVSLPAPRLYHPRTATVEAAMNSRVRRFSGRGLHERGVEWVEVRRVPGLVARQVVWACNKVARLKGAGSKAVRGSGRQNERKWILYGKKGVS